MDETKRSDHPDDIESDPAKQDDQSDWSDEGGATPEGPATTLDD